VVTVGGRHSITACGSRGGEGGWRKGEKLTNRPRVAVREKEERGEGAGPAEVNVPEEEVGLWGRRAGLRGEGERFGGFPFFSKPFLLLKPFQK
jgi:hypothetical protein